MKRVWKRWGALLLAVVMTLSLLPTAALAEGETEGDNLALNKTTYASGQESSDLAKSKAVDGDPSTHWGGTKMKNGAAGTATAQNAFSWFVVDLLSGDDSNRAVNSISSVTMSFNLLVWPTECCVQVATDNVSGALAKYEMPSTNGNELLKVFGDYTGDLAYDSTKWKTIATFSKESSADGANGSGNVVTMSTDYEENVTESGLVKVKPASTNFAAIPKGVRYVRVCFTGINTNAGGTCIGMKELTVKGTTQPTVTQYLRHTGPIEEGIYVIYDNGRNLHNQTASPIRTDQCGTPAPNGDTIGVGDGNHLWRIAGNDTDGYTIQGDKSGYENYLTTSETNSTQLALSSDSAAAVKLSIVEAPGVGYKLSYVDNNGTTKYFGLRSGQNGWEFSETLGTVQLFKKTAVPVTIAAADDGSRDVGAESGTYNNTDNSVIEATASSWHGSGEDNVASYAVDGATTGNVWHTQYESNGGGFTPAQLAESVENRWLQLEIKSDPLPWISGLRYMGKGSATNGNGYVKQPEVRVSNSADGPWGTVVSGNWTMSTNGWEYVEFDAPVQAKYVRLYGLEVQHGNLDSAMNAKEVRLVKALTQTAPATQTVTVTVKGTDGNAMEGATVSGGGKVATTDASGEATLDLVNGNTYTLTVSKEGFKTRTVKVTVDGEAVTAEVALREAVEATDRTHDYPLTNADVTAYSWENSGNDRPPYAALDNDLTTHWHTRWTGAEGASTDNNRTNGKWFQFTVREDSRKVLGVAYCKRGDGNNITTWELKTSTTEKTDAEWFAAPAEATGTFHTANQNWQLADFETPVDAKYVRIYATDSDQHSTAAEFRLVLDPSEKFYDISGTVTNATTNAAVEGAMVSTVGKTVTTDENGQYTLNVLNGTYTLTVSKGGFDSATIENVDATAANVTGKDVSLAPLTLTLTGTVKGSDNTTVEGAKLTLLTHDNNRDHTEGVEVATSGNDGTFSIDASAFGLGQAYLLVTHQNYETKCIEVTLTAENNGTNALGDDAIVLTRNDPYKVYTFDGENAAAEVAEFTANDDTVRATATLENGAMKYTMVDNASTTENIIVNKNFVLKDGTVEFDVTPITSIGNARFGVVLHVPDGKNARIHIGRRDGEDQYGYQAYNHNAEISGAWGSASGNPQLGQNVTRHIAITLNGTVATVNVDGKEAWRDSNVTLPSDDVAGYIGFTTRYGTTQFLIDNLVVRRADTASAVTLSAGEGETLTAAIVTPANQTGTALASGGNAYAGDTIKITGSKTGAILNAVTVNGSADGVTQTPVEGGGYEYTFTMPGEAATVAGTFVDLIPDFTVSGPDASGNISAGTVTESGFTGNTLTITGEMATDNAATFEWYKKTGDGAWTKMEGETGNSYTIKESDYNSTTTTKLKVKVTGNGTHHAGWKESGEYTVTAPVYAVTAVSLHRTELTMWTNYAPTASEEFPAEVGSTATLTATVGPQNVTGATITWSSDSAAVTVEKSATNDKEATVTAVSKGTANITVSVTAGGVTKSVTCAVTVKTRVAGITVKNGETVVTESAPAKVYLNDDDDEAPRSITLIGTVDPTTASDTGLVWTRTGGATGKINIQPAGGSDTNPDSATSSGSGVTISAVGTDSKNVGEVIVKVAAHDGKGAETTFKVQVWRKLAHDVTIGGTPKYGETLEVNTDSLDMTTAGKDALTYQWKRDGADISGATSKTYELVEADIGATISVVVTAGANTFYEGSKTASTATTVAKADGPAPPTGLGTTACTTDDNNDGTITGLTAGKTYEVCKQGADESWDWESAEEKTADASGAITGLAPGNYQVRVPGTTTTKPGAASTTLNILENGANAKNITIDSGIQNGDVSTNRSAVDPTDTVTVRVTPATGYKLKAGTLKVTQKSDNAEVAVSEGDEDSTWTFTMPNDDVTITAQFEPIQITITLALTNITATCDAGGSHTNNATHTVDYGAVETITLTAVNGYELPQSITVTYTDPEDTATAPGTRWNYSRESGKITFTYGAQKDITITATATQITYTVQLSATGGHLDLSGDEDTVNHGADFTGTLSVSDTAYELPSEITVTMGDRELTAGTDYTYTQSTGAISIPNVIGDVTITAEAKAKTTEVAGVTIGITHSDSTGMGSGNQDVPHVGDTLTATAAPAGATVTYQWFVGESETAAGTSQTFVVPDTEGIVGQTIKVVVTGTGTYSGTANATTVAVGEKTWRVTGVSLNKTTTSLVFGGEETLTATVEPSTATNKNVTWSSSNTNVATVDASGNVTTVGVGDATITVTTADGARTATCHVTVTAKALPELKINKPKAGQNAVVSFAGGVSTDVATYEWYIGSSPNEDSSDWSRQNGASGASWTVPENTPSGKYLKVIATAKSDGNYKGTSTVVSAEILSNDVEVETYAITVDTTGDGTVTVKANGAEATEAAEGDEVTIEVTGLVAGATVEATSETTGVTLIKGTGNTWSFTMPAEAVEITVTITEPVVEKYAITVSDAANGTVTADKEEAAEGATVTLTDTPDEGYKLDSLTVTGASGTPVMVVQEMTHGSEEIIWKFTMPAEAVTVTATFVEDTTPPDTSALEAAITAAENAKNNVEVAENAEEVPSNKKFVSQEEMDALNDAIDAAKDALNAADKTDESVAEAVETLNAAVEAFKNACQQGTKKVSTPVVVIPSTTTETKENEDGSVTTTVTSSDGTVTETTEKPDGTVSEVVTEPDGTITETTTQPDGAKVEKITDPEEGVTVTATDAEGEVVAEVKVPAVIPETETRFVDVPEGHWADESIHKIAAMALVEGVGDNKYDMESDVTRGALATILHRMSNKPAGSEVSFQDVLDDKYYTEGVAWAAKVGVVEGFSANTFKPEQTITREQLALMLMRYAKLLGMDVTADAEVLNVYTDGNATHAWAVDGVAWCVKTGIIQGKSEEILAPTDNVTRAQVAVMLDRFIALMR